MGISSLISFRHLGGLSRGLVMTLGAVMLVVMQGCGGSSSGSGGGGTTTPPPVLSITTSTLPGGTVGTAYSAVLVASGGSGSGYAFTVSAGSLPAGMGLATSGTVSGTPTAAGTSNFTAKVTDSAGNTATAALSIAVAPATVVTTTPLTNYEFPGDTSPVHDPSIMRQGSTYYVFVTDAGQTGGYIPIRCSTDKIAWTGCGYVFSALPSWIATTVPGATGIWAPDISYFGGLYHLYYAVSTFGSQVSAIGLATTPTLNEADPSYAWTDHGAVLTSTTGDDFNAIDPNILVDADGSVWLTYGSFWNGIFQQQVNPATGQLMTGTTYHLAERASSVAADPIEGASLVKKGSYYYLFVSWDYCCATPASTSDYKIVVGRGTSPSGPFLDETGVDMAAGGGTVLLQGDGVNWIAPGGQTAYIDSTDGDLIVLHALSVQQNYLDFLFVRSLSFTTGWPVIGTTTVSTGTGAASTTTVAASPNPVTAGSALALTATVAGSSPTGTVMFYSGADLIGNCALGTGGSCTFSDSSLAVGTYSMTAVYMGDANNAGSISTAVSVTVNANASAGVTSTIVTTANATPVQGAPIAIEATAALTMGTAVLSGSISFSDGATLLATEPMDSTGKATLDTAKLGVGAHSITASYVGNANYMASTSSALAVTVKGQTGTTYTNPLTITDPTLGAVTSCPDPNIIKSQTSGVDTWYLYCTGDPHNGSDLVNGQLAQHLISVYSSSDLVNWTSVGDAFKSLPSWAGSGALLWAPSVKYMNGMYYLYYTVTATTYTGGTSGIGVGTSATAAGPFTDSGAAVIEPELVPAGMDAAGQGRWIYDPDVIADSTGQLYILYGSFQGGISVRKLSANGLTSDPTTETLIADDQRYEGGAWIQHGGYYYLMASATNCCAGPLTGYGVFAGRATTPMGPYTDAAGNSLTGVNVGGTPVLAMNGNTIVGPGGGSPFVDESGQAYYVYHGVLKAEPYFTNTLTTQRPALIDAMDWVNNWPVVRGGFGPSDAASPQPKPVSQPGGTSNYVTTTEVQDVPGVAIAGLSEDFNTTTLGSQWSGIHSVPAYTLTGSVLSMPTVGFDTTNAMASVPILAEATPVGDYMVEVELSTSVPDNTSLNDYAQAGLLIYGNDANYLRVDLYSNSDTRQVEFIKGETPEGANYPTWSATDLGPATSVSGILSTYIRLVKRTIDGVETYTGYNSVDGVNWVRCGAWTHSLGSGAQIGLYAGNRAGYTASFDYVHVTNLQ
jgi:arabinan endo-1,5-alpha-L-arabinosidase